MTKTCLKLLVNGLAILFPVLANAGQFINDFNTTGIPAGTSVLGNAGRFSSGGYTNSGGLRLTSTVTNQTGSWLINDLDTNKAVVSFAAAFKMQVSGGSGGEGFSFNLATNYPGTAFGEAGGGTGLSVCFDSNDNGDGFTAPGIRVLVGGSVVQQVATPIRNSSGAFSNVLVKLDPDGTLDVAYGNDLMISNLPITMPSLPGAKFAFGGRTGTKTDTNMLDNVFVRTRSSAGPYVDSATPIGVVTRPDITARFVIKDFTTQVNTNSIRLTLDGASVTPTISSDGLGNTTVTYKHSSILTATAHNYDLTFADNSVPPATNVFRHVVDVQSYRTLPTNYIVAPPVVDTNTAGFKIAVHQISANLGISVSRAEKQFADELIDPGTGQPYGNIAALGPNPDGTYDETTSINYDALQTGGVGNFPNDAPMPGLPGNTGSVNHYAMEAITYLQLNPGFYMFGVNANDGFRLTSGNNPRDLFSTEIAVFDSSRTSSADTLGGIVVQQAGIYPFRLLFFQGTGGASVEFFTVDENGVKTLVNSVDAGAVKAYREATVTRPYLRSASPTPNQSAVPNNASITLKVVNGTITVQTNTIQLALDSTNVTAEISQSGGVTTISYTPPVNFSPASTHTVRLIYTDSTAVTTTNQYSFTTALNLSQIWYIAPGSTPYVTLNSSPRERGLAYNPATDHVLVVSRITTPQTIGIYNAANGTLTGTLDVSGITDTDTFALNMIDVADDGVIYAANLNWTSSTRRLRVYRWADESSAPVKVYDADPMVAEGYPYWVRFGDTMRVRRAGSGTQILFNGNFNNGDPSSPSTNALILTTTNGINFQGKVLNVSGIDPGDLRLGCAWGCGNTFYGAQTASGFTTVRHVSFDPTTGDATAINSYILRVPAISGDSTPTIGPIGVDHASQRLLANATAIGDPLGSPFNGPTHPHSMNLYDLGTLAGLPSENYAVDQYQFVSQNGNFGTGSIDFTPNGDRVFTLDSNNGIVAFALSPTATEPGICTPPSGSTNRVGSLAFFGIEATGTPLNYQWRFNGSGIPGATNKNLSIPNVQVSNAGQYSVSVYNNLGSVVTTPVDLHVSATILTQPSDTAVNQGQNGTLTVVADGEGPLTYQWRKDGVNLAGKTAATLSIPNAQVSDAGAYSVFVSNPYGTDLSQTILFNVIISSTPGNGIGLIGDYFGDTNLTDPAILSRVDTTIDFDWLTGSPDPSVPVDDFSVRWHGFIQPLYSQTYRFYTRTDDGVRLYVNNQLLIDKWVNQAPTEWTGTIALTANQKYPITMEYYERGGGALAQLKWWSASQVKAVVPMEQLYTNAPPSNPGSLSVQRSGSNLTIDWTGSFHLQSATNVEGPYIDTGITAGPFTTNTTTRARMFFRLSN